ncbi:MAG: hypothetical protein CVU77_02580 [Elusimicrobia bacterium HGW-Elusimicrobia-1]|jgi:hypothetical protein|nr:MAG: hypothetical protein CVU79_11140 [Elusimicrobia bacterium HGW-Elusimicrobia-3]PKN01845.1 MAG: hypothetical protein CVU77_02580 [Elusimicrobia bacterium HGW-Elusimicrobia-1]
MQTFKPINKRLGDLLVETKLITQAQLADALDIQRKKAVKIGRALLDKGYVTEDLLLAFLGRQCGISYVSLKEFGGISPEAVRAVPEYLARQWEISPLKVADDTITIAVSDPFNLFATDDLRLITGLAVATVIAPADEIKAFVDRYYVARALTAGRSASDAPASALEMAARIGATEMYFDVDRIRYFFGQKYLKTVELTQKESDVLAKYFKQHPRARVRVPFRGGNALASLDIELSGKPAAEKIKIRNTFLPASLREFGISSDDSMVLEKHLAGRGFVAVSGAPASGKSTFMAACARWAATTQKIVYFFSETSPEILSGTSAICAGASLIADYLPGAHNVFFDGGSSSSLPANIDSLSAGSAMAASFVEELPPEAASARLYVRLALVKKLCPDCKKQYAVSRDYIVNSGLSVPVKDNQLILSKSSGCESCDYTGSSGASAVYYMSEECSRLTVEEIRSKILEAVWAKALAGEVSVEEVLLYK